MTDEQFATIWNSCASAKEAAVILGGATSMRAYRIRKSRPDLAVKRMPFRQTLTIETRFWKMVEKSDGCWLWTGSVNKKGYGQIATKRGSRPLFAHRFSFELHFGPIQGDLLVLHSCDQPSCVQPSHLFLGNAADNTRDMIVKERGWWQANAPHHEWTK